MTGTTYTKKNTAALERGRQRRLNAMQEFAKKRLAEDLKEQGLELEPGWQDHCDMETRKDMLARSEVFFRDRIANRERFIKSETEKLEAMEHKGSIELAPEVESGGIKQQGVRPDPSDAETKGVSPSGLARNAALQGKEVFKEGQELKKRISDCDHVSVTKKIDPRLIEATKWANRHEQSFASEEFQELVKEIGVAGGNVQPIKVRPVPGSEPQRYEIVFGHRRHRACQELGLQVLAMIEPIDDQRLFIEMDRENRSREDLRTFEQGAMYLKAIREGLFKNKAELTKATGVNEGLVSQAVKIAELPSRILKAFRSPLDIQYRWAKPLTDMAEKHSVVLDENLKQLSTENAVANKEFTPANIFVILTDLKEHVGPAPRELIVASSGSVVAELSLKGGRLTISFDKALKLDDKAINRVKKALEKLDLG
jgi:ParB family chromosome partitioning protein